MESRGAGWSTPDQGGAGGMRDIYIYIYTVPSISIGTVKTKLLCGCGVKTFANMIKR